MTGPKRVAAAPDIPTIAESGMNGFDFVSWYGLWGPKGLPADITTKLQSRGRQSAGAAGHQAAARPARLRGDRLDRRRRSRRSSMKKSAKYGRIIREAGIKGE